MKFHFSHKETTYAVDLESGCSIAIDLDFDGPQPNHFGVAKANKKPLTIDGFVGATAKGGGCNVDVVELIPHCNGTHTESVGHIVDQRIDVAGLAKQSFFLAQLITLEPKVANDLADRYTPELNNADFVVSAEELRTKLESIDLHGIEALVVRTTPNDESKRSRDYSKGDSPAFFSSDAMQAIAETSIKHLIVDLPSVDRIHDDGLLSNHHLFWLVEPGKHQTDERTLVDRTITELVYVPDTMEDGRYLLNLQVAPFCTDAAPSRPILFPLSEA